MPVGRYTVFGDEGTPVGSEEFRCAPGPMGWRYFGEIQTDEPEPHREIVDLTVDADWRLVRLRVAAGAHELVLGPRGGRLVGERDGEPLDLPWSGDHHLDYLTPAANAVTCRRLDGTTEIEVVYVQPYTLVPTSMRQRYELLGPDLARTPVGAFDAIRWRYTSLTDDPWTGDLWMAGDVVVSYEGLYELAWYEPGATGVAVAARGDG